MKVEVGSQNGETPVLQAREARPFQWLEPQAQPDGLSDEAEAGLAYLQFIAFEDDAFLARALTNWSFQQDAPDRLAFRKAPTISVLNRRRRSARLWVNAILDGAIDEETTRQLTHTWLPQLAGTGPNPADAVPAGRKFVEYLRASFTAIVLGQPAENLVRHARALYSLEIVLAAHLDAILAQAPQPAS